MDIWGEAGRATVLPCWSGKVLGRGDSLGEELRRKRSELSPHPGKEHSSCGNSTNKYRGKSSKEEDGNEGGR